MEAINICTLEWLPIKITSILSMIKLSVVLAVRNEEANLTSCLNSIKNIADEIVIVDEYSTDKTIEIAEKFNARIYKEPHHEIFHITKQKALSLAKGEWILQLDADEIVTPPLASEISQLINKGTHITITSKEKLFNRHQKLIEQRDGSIGDNNKEIVGYFIPRVNLFLGKPLIHAGVYPDAVIRLVKRGYAHFPAKSVHEQIHLDGKVGWLYNDMLHNDSPTLSKYIVRLNRYTDLHADELRVRHAPKNIVYFFYYAIFKAKLKFLSLYIRHKGFQDGIRGFLWSVFSAWHFPIAYFKYWTLGSQHDRL
jgi:glycosyltransferase involved in cell wall biosynthesis